MKKLTIILLALSFSVFGNDKELSNTEIQDLKRQEAEQYAEKHRLAELKYNRKESKKNISAIDYFLPKKDAIYHYDKLGPTLTGAIKDSISGCHEPKTIHDRLYLYCEVIAFLGDMEIKSEYAYEILPNIIILDTFKNEMMLAMAKKLGVISHEDKRFPVPFYLPKTNLKMKWVKNDGNGSLCTSSFMSQVTTKLKVFKNIVLAECEFGFDGQYYLEKTYYAFGYGLVKKEQYIENKFIPFLSKEIVDITENLYN